MLYVLKLVEIWLKQQTMSIEMPSPNVLIQVRISNFTWIIQGWKNGKYSQKNESSFCTNCLK